MKKWKIALMLFAVCLLFGAGNVFAAEETEPERVYDMADLFSDEEEEALNEQIMALREKMKMDAAVVTAEANSGSAKDYADDFYDEMGLGIGKNYDGALFLIDMENGELWISTSGKMVRYLTDDRIETILDDTFEYAADGMFYDAAAIFLEDLEICYENGIADDQYTYDEETGKVSRYHSIKWYEVLIAFAAAAGTAGTAVLGVVHDYNMKNSGSKLAANFNLSYRKDSSFTPGHFLSGVLLGSYVTRQVIASQNHSSGGSGGRSGGTRSLSSGGRSTVHRSSSGRSHGGGGRKFR